jgi:hypothetical protein
MMKKLNTSALAAVVKGLVEKSDDSYFFGSTLSLAHNRQLAIQQGLITEDRQVTAAGMAWYDRCLKALPEVRQTCWLSIPEPGIYGDSGDVTQCHPQILLRSRKYQQKILARLHQLPVI